MHGDTSHRRALGQIGKNALATLFGMLFVLAVLELGLRVVKRSQDPRTLVYNKASLDAAARAAKKGVVIVRSSRVATGTVGRNVEVNDDELGFVASDELNPQKARVLLSLALLKQRTNKQLQDLFYTY